MTHGATESPWLRELAGAHAAPWEVADRWRASGGKVVGLFGRYAPREIVLAAGALPIRLDPERVSRRGVRFEAADGTDPSEGLRGELSQETFAIVRALLAGSLDWIDGLVIGRDSETHTKLFYVIREMAGDPEYASRIPPFAFCDLLRLPNRTSAVYNRLRLSQLCGAVAEWSGREVSTASLRAAVAAEAATLGLLRELDGLRAEGRITGGAFLRAALGAQVLPVAEADAALAAAVAAARLEPLRTPGPAVLLTGSEPTPEIYDVLDASELAIVGDDHWPGPAWNGRHDPSADPLDALAERYQFSPIGAARAGLNRVAPVAERARHLDVAAVLQVVLPADEASEWELAELRSLLPELRVTSIGFDPEAGYEPLRESAAELLGALGREGQAVPSDGGGISG